MSQEIESMFEEVPVLTLEIGTEFEPESVKQQTIEVTQKAQEIVLTPQEQKMVDEFATKIDLTNSNMILQYGAGAQKKIANFAESALNNVRTKDLGEVGQMLTDVVTELKTLEVAPEEKGIRGFFKRSTNKLTAMKVKYDKAEVNVNRICDVLENHQIQLLKDIAMLDKMYDLNTTYFKELSMYILAGKKRLEEAKDKDIPALLAKANRTGLPEDAQAANDLASLHNRFEKKLHDLELTRMVSLQMAPQIRLVQGNDTVMAEKIQSTIVNTIPLWKSQMVLAIGINHSEQAAKAQRDVTNMTNELLRKNADILKTATIETAKESERGIVDMETLKYTNASLISTLDEVVRIQGEGKEKRRAAEVELSRLESELKQKLLNISR
ncbi:MAG: toxic anion resistance protein [Cellulosilyticaceae bacterium]